MRWPGPPVWTTFMRQVSVLMLESLRAAEELARAERFGDALEAERMMDGHFGHGFGHGFFLVRFPLRATRNSLRRF